MKVKPPNDDDKNIINLHSWMLNILNINKLSYEYKCDVVVQTPWSVVIKLEVDGKIYYLKQTPPDLFIETDVVDCLNKSIENAPVPVVVQKNNELNCFIMKSCGEQSLRTKFNGKLDTDLLIQGLKAYIQVQRDVENDINIFTGAGVPDWKINNIPTLYKDFLEKTELLKSEGLSTAEIDVLIKLTTKVEDICKILSEYKIKETLVNCDFNENNMILDEKIDSISIIDWGESVISHPFFSIAAHLQMLARRYNLKLNGELLENVRQKCLSHWLDFESKTNIDEIYKSIIRLMPIYSALSLYRLQHATQNKSKDQQRWFIKGQLQPLLDKNI